MNISSQDLRQARSYPLRYAMIQLHDPALAEDVVQKTLTAWTSTACGSSSST